MKLKGQVAMITGAGRNIGKAMAKLFASEGGRIAGAGFDVYPKEPLPKDHPLRSLPNVVMQPHMGDTRRKATAGNSSRRWKISSPSSKAGRRISPPTKTSSGSANGR